MSNPALSAQFIAPRVLRITRLPLSADAAGRLRATARSATTARTHDIEIRPVSGSESAIDLHLPSAAFGDPADKLSLTLRGESDVAFSLTIATGQEQIVGAVDLFQASRVIGWCSHLASGRRIDRTALTLYVDGERQDVPATAVMRQDLAEASLYGGEDGFAFLMPPRLFDGAEHAVKVSYGQKVLRSQRSRFQFALELETLERRDRRLSGRARIIGTPIADLELALCGALHIFSTSPAKPITGTNEIEFELLLPPLHDRVLSELVVAPRHIPRAPLIRLGDQALFSPDTAAPRQLARLVRTLPGLPPQTRTRLIEEIVAPQLAAARNAAPTRRLRGNRGPDPMPAVTIVVPVYDGVDTTRECLQSLAASNLPADARVTVVADCPPADTMLPMLRDVCDKAGFTLVENTANLGFVGTCNAAIAAAGDRDIVLLNSDTLLPGGWLDRLRRAATAAPDIASATPFSNNATILSYPLPNAISPTSRAEVDDLDARFERLNGGKTIDIPTAVGFCMYVRRAAVDDVGTFDEIWGAGYGEENDWCMRAADRGWRHVAATDVYVGHVGGVSFGAGAIARMEQNGAILDRRYPDYRALVQDFIALDPLWQARLEVDLSRLAAAPVPTILHVEHGRGGGMEVHIDLLEAQLGARGVRSLRLRPRRYPNERPGYRIVSNDPPLDLTFPTAELPKVVDQLIATGLTDIHIHSFLNLPSARDARQFATFGLPVTMTLHDHGVICPRVSLTGTTGRYCGEPDLDACEACVKSLGVHPVVERYDEEWGSVAAWRRHTAAVVRSAGRLVAPSASCATRISRHVGGARIDVVGGLEQRREFQRRAPRASSTPRIGILGAIDASKGLNELKRLIASAAKRALPLHFEFVGFTSDDRGTAALQTTTTTVNITGPYQTGDVDALLRHADLDLGLILSVMPETHCYTLTEMWTAGIPVLAFDLGAQAERIRATGAGFLVDSAATTEELLDAVLGAIASLPSLPETFAEAAPAYPMIDAYEGLRRLGDGNGSGTRT